MPELEEIHGSGEAGVPETIGSVTMKRLIAKEKTSQDLSSASLSYEDVTTNRKKFLSATIHFSAAVNQTVEVFVIDPDSNYTVRIATQTLTAAEDVVLVPTIGEEYIVAGTDKFKITCTNSGTPSVIAYVTLRLEDLG